MYDRGKVIIGLVVFLLLVGVPIWYNRAAGRSEEPLKLQVGTDAKACVESKEFMKASHMILLQNWRNEVVRQNERIYQASDRKRYVKSLSRTCLGCHTDKTQFCDKCHGYMGVATPPCWDCHVAPKEKKQWVSTEGISSKLQALP
jgi:hypothetical protein